ncbi:MAG: hypothetical protein MHM6MM_002586 [Cercozoa sp. M6MM]
MSFLEHKWLLNRWVVLLSSLLLFVALGQLYAWGSETVYITSWLRTHIPNVVYEDTLFVFGATSVGLSVGGLVVGKAFDQWPKMMRWINLGGAVIFVASIAVAPLSRSLPFFLGTYGFTRGFGMGIAHLGPLIAVQRWFPKNLGLANGIVAAALGGGAFVTIQVFAALVNPWKDSLPDGEQYFPPDSRVTVRVPKSLWQLAFIFIFVALIPAALIANPLPKPRPASVANADESFVEEDEMDGHGHGGASLSNIKDMPVRETLRSGRFYLVVLAFILSTMGGHVVIGTYKTVGQQYHSDHALNLLGAIAALGNSSGRVVFGLLLDRFGYRLPLAAAMVVQMVLLLVYPASWIMSSLPLFGLLTTLLFMLYGAAFAIFPYVTCTFFGIKNFGLFYGVVMFGWGFAGLVADTIVKILFERLTLFWFFAVFAGVSVLAFVAALLLRPPTENDPKSAATDGDTDGAVDSVAGSCTCRPDDETDSADTPLLHNTGNDNSVNYV